MGDLNLLKTGILGEAEAEATRIKQDAEARTSEILGEARAAAEARRREILQQAQKDATARQHRVAVNFELEGKREGLRLKDRIIEEAISLAVKKVHQLPLDRKAGLFVRLLFASAEAGTEEIRAAKADRSLIEGLLPQVNQELQKAGKQGRLHMGPDAGEIEGGFILVGPSYRADNSLGSLLLSNRDDLIPSVARILFQ